jgi:hypothetical protein
MESMQVFNVRDPAFGARGDGVADDTVAIQKAIDAAQPTHGVVFIPAGTYRVSRSLRAYNGTQIRGETGYQYPAGFGENPRGTRIDFRPTNVADLLVFGWKGSDGPGFVFHIAVEDLYVAGNSVRGASQNSRHALALNSVIYARFENLGIEGFSTPVRCSGTINNRFTNVYLQGTTSCVDYAGNLETTDVWSQCTFTLSPAGVRFAGSAVDVRFTDCLFESLDDVGADIAKECQSIVFTGCYAENVPQIHSSNENAAMFRVGHAGKEAVLDNHLTVIGGKFAGQNDSPHHGAFIDVDESTGIMVCGVSASRWPVLVKTTPRTAPASCLMLGVVGIGWRNFTNDETRITGLYSFRPFGAGGPVHRARLDSIQAASSSSPDEREEWAPRDLSGASLKLGKAGGSSQKVGRTATVRGNLSYPRTTDQRVAVISGLPYAVAADDESAQVFITFSDQPSLRYARIDRNTRTIKWLDASGRGLTNAELSGKTISFTAIYDV